MANLSEVFKFTQGLGQKGHQIGRKVGDAIELLTLAMIHRDEELTKYLEIENGVEGETSAKHKVEFAFYNLADGKPSKKPEDLFGIIECKKVGAEQTVKQSFKKWSNLAQNRKPFNETDGYLFKINPSGVDYSWEVSIKCVMKEHTNFQLEICRKENELQKMDLYEFDVKAGEQVLVALCENNNLHVLGPGQLLSEVQEPVNRCNIVEVLTTENSVIKKINVNDALTGPQTPEKAKQASFVSLDVRKKVLKTFDVTENKSFVSYLVIGEASHWEDKSRAMVRLSNDANLIIPDNILIYLFEAFESKFGEEYQDRLTKTAYKTKADVKAVVVEVVDHFDGRVLQDMDSGAFTEFYHEDVDGKNYLRLREQ